MTQSLTWYHQVWLNHRNERAEVHRCDNVTFVEKLSRERLVYAPPRPTLEIRSGKSMHIGDLVTYEGRLHYLRGVEPFNVAEPQADLEDCETGRQVRARLSEVIPAVRSQEMADLAERTNLEFSSLFTGA